MDSIYDVHEYAKKVEQTAIYPEAGEGSELAISYVTLGLNGEAGEVAEKIKKWLRDTPLSATEPAFILDLMHREVTPELLEAVQKELGDVAWYWIRLHQELGLDPATTLGMNVEKLASRKNREKLSGSGDDR